MRIPDYARFRRTAPSRISSVVLLLTAVLAIIGCKKEPRPQAASGQRPGETGGATAHAAAFVDQNVPSQMVADRSYAVSIRMRNTGTAPWTDDEHYRIGSVNPLDNKVWGLHRVPVPVVVAPGAEVAFTFELKAPQVPGEYNFQWRMVQDGVEWFGDETPNVLVTVAGEVSKKSR